MTRTHASLLGLATLAAFGLAARPAAAQDIVTQFNSPILTAASPSGAETLVFSGLITNFGTSTVTLESAGFPSFISDAAEDGIDLDFDKDLFNGVEVFMFAPGTMTPVNFIDATLSPGQAAGLYNIPSAGGSVPALTLGFSDGETTNTDFAVNVTPAAPAATPEPSAFVGLGIGLLGLSALGVKARRRSTLA